MKDENETEEWEYLMKGENRADLVVYWAFCIV